MRTIISIFFLLVGIPSFSQPLIPFLEEKAIIDGVLADPVWKEIKPLSAFYNHFPIDEGLAANQTTVKIFHNQQYLFIGAVYHDSQSNNNISSLKRDVYEESIYLSDGFGVAIDPFDKGDNGYLFSINASGVQYDALIGNIDVLDESWNAIWQSKVSKNGSEKIYEIAIPLDAINFDPTKNTWGIQFFTNDTKVNQFSTLEPSPRNFAQYDLRFTKKMILESLPNKVTRKYSLLPSLAWNKSRDHTQNTNTHKFIPSIDAQYNISSALRLDATINPDFSQVEVDQQVTNLTRFAINFPERRKFFLENSDLFNNLGTSWSNPFYSRQIGAQTDIMAGVKLSGNIGSKTRIGLLNVQTKADAEVKGKNYAVLVGRQNLSNSIIATLFLVNSQQKNYFNRVVGTNLNYKSVNKKWISNVNFAQAYTSNLKGDNNFVNAAVAYQTRKFNWDVSYQRAEKNYLTETGFVPLLYNYDALTQQTTREDFDLIFARVQLKHYPKDSKTIDWMRRFYFINRSILNADQSLRENFFFFSPFAIRFKNRSYVYLSLINQIENLNYYFDLLQNGNFVIPNQYNQTYGRVGYWSTTNKKIYYTLRFEYGQFYSGTRINPEVTLAYRLIPTAVLSASYELNQINLHELGAKRFHLGKLTSEIYFSNRLNWTTYFQYNTQGNNFNINSRIQWEYRPLSYVYLVLTNNYDNQLLEKNWGVSFKINRRLDF